MSTEIENMTIFMDFHQKPSTKDCLRVHDEKDRDNKISYYASLGYDVTEKIFISNFGSSIKEPSKKIIVVDLMNKANKENCIPIWNKEDRDKYIEYFSEFGCCIVDKIFISAPAKSTEKIPNKSAEKIPNKSTEKTSNKSTEKTPNKSTEKTPTPLPDKDSLIKKITTDESIPEMRRIGFSDKIDEISDNFKRFLFAHVYIPNIYVKDFVTEYYRALGYKVTVKDNYVDIL